MCLGPRFYNKTTKKRIQFLKYYGFRLVHKLSLVLQPWMSAYIRKTDGVYIFQSPKNDKNMDDKTLRFTESMA
jgi:hypothetical protein